MLWSRKDAQKRARAGSTIAHTPGRKKEHFIRDHNWWHAALFRLALGKHDEALSIYDARLWGEWPEFPQEQIGAVSMLWRLEMRGADVGNRWAPVVEQSRLRAGEHLLPFHDLHIFMPWRAPAMTARPTNSSLQCVVIQINWGATPVQFGAAFAVPAAECLIDFIAGDYDRAATKLTSVLPQLQKIGGSHAQRHVFVETYEACVTAGDETVTLLR